MSFFLAEGLPNQPPEARLLYQSAPCRKSSSMGMGQVCFLPSGSAHSSMRPHSLPSLSRVMPFTESGGPMRTSFSSPSGFTSSLYSPGAFAFRHKKEALRHGVIGILLAGGCNDNADSLKGTQAVQIVEIRRLAFMCRA